MQPSTDTATYNPGANGFVLVRVPAEYAPSVTVTALSDEMKARQAWESEEQARAAEQRAAEEGEQHERHLGESVSRWRRGVPIGPAVVSGQSGGTVQSGVSIDGKTYDIYTFTDDTNDSMSITLSTGGSARVLLVGGGGCGGPPGTKYPGGGGGAGEMFEEEVALPAGELPVVVGSGGGLRAANWGSNVYALNGGQASSVGGVAACGGGYGGGYKATRCRAVTVAQAAEPVVETQSMCP